MIFLQVARKELAARRMSTVVMFCLCSLVLTGGASLIPRSYTSRAVLQLDLANPEAVELGERLRDRFVSANDAVADVRVEAELNDGEVIVRYTTDDATAAPAGLGALLFEAGREELRRARDALRDTEEDLVRQAAASEARVAAAQQQLDAALSGLPEGGESALGARIGQLQGERDTLEADLRTAGGLSKALDVRLADTAETIVALQQVAALLAANETELKRQRERLAAARAAGDAALIEEVEAQVRRLGIEHETLVEQGADARTRIERDLLPQQRQLASRRATLLDDIKLKQQRRTEISVLLERARAESASLQEGGQAIRVQQRAYDDAVALNRQINLRLQGARLDLELRGTVRSLPFGTLRAPGLPQRPDGLPAWAFVLFALAGAAVATLLELIGAILIDDRIRLAETVFSEVEVPVLAVIPDYQPLRTIRVVRWRMVGVALLCVGTVAANVVFLIVFG